MIITSLAVLELGISPLVISMMEGIIDEVAFYGSKFYLYSEIPHSLFDLSPYFIILSSYASIALGMVLVRLFSLKRNDGRSSSAGPLLGSMLDRYSNFGWHGSLIVALIGFLANVYRLIVVLKYVPVGEIASIRAFYTQPDVTGFPYFQLAGLFSTYIQVGAWGMILFGRNQALRRRLGILVSLVYVTILVLSGGRANSLFAIAGTALIYHWGVARLSPRELGMLAFVAVASQVALADLRFGEGSTWQQAMASWFGSFLISDAVAAARFVEIIFPSQIPFLRGASIIGGLSHVLPGAFWPGSANLWRVVTDHFWGGRRASGISGGNFALGAEHYANGGFLGVILLGLGFGILFGMLFDWQTRNRKNPFALLLIVGVYLAFIQGSRAKMAANVSGMIIGYSLPVALIAALSLRRSRMRIGLIVCLYYGLVFYIAHELAPVFNYLDYLKYVAVGLGAIAYVFAFRLIRDSTTDISDPSNEDFFTSANASK